MCLPPNSVGDWSKGHKLWMFRTKLGNRKPGAIVHLIISTCWVDSNSGSSLAQGSGASIAQIWGYIGTKSWASVSLNSYTVYPLWQNRLDYMAHMCLSLSYRLLTAAHESQTTLEVYRVSSGNPNHQRNHFEQDTSQESLQYYNSCTNL